VAWGAQSREVGGCGSLFEVSITGEGSLQRLRPLRGCVKTGSTAQDGRYKARAGSVLSISQLERGC
jgi:hypothetical protein